jgi:uncharacterized membrane protein YraQ (UPF0718 family)
MRSQAQRWLFWIIAAAAAFQIYVVREWLAALLLFAVVFALLALALATVLLFDAATRFLATAFAASSLPRQSRAAVTRIVHLRASFAKTFLANSNPQ